jgi:hypothetical protein
MDDIVNVACPRCSRQTVVLIPSGTEVVGTAADLDASWPSDADTAVQTNCPHDSKFLVFLGEQ